MLGKKSIVTIWCLLFVLIGSGLHSGKAESVCADGYGTVVMDRTTNLLSFTGNENDLSQIIVSSIGESVAIACSEKHVCAIREASYEAQCIGSNTK